MPTLAQALESGDQKKIDKELIDHFFEGIKQNEKQF